MVYRDGGRSRHRSETGATGELVRGGQGRTGGSLRVDAVVGGVAIAGVIAGAGLVAVAMVSMLRGGA